MAMDKKAAKTSKVVSYNLPVEVVEWVDAIAKASGQSKSEVVATMLMSQRVAMIPDEQAEIAREQVDEILASMREFLLIQIQNDQVRRLVAESRPDPAALPERVDVRRTDEADERLRARMDEMIKSAYEGYDENAT